MVRKLAAAVAVFAVAVLAGGAGVRLLAFDGDPAHVWSVVIIAFAVLAAVWSGSRGRRLRTPYW